MMRKPIILLVEDNLEILRINKQAFLTAGYEVLVAETLHQAEIHIMSGKPHLIVLDIVLPDGSGLEFCRRIRSITTAPILFLTSLGDHAQMIDGLTAGGDDYIVKPYHVDELVVRVSSRLRHIAQLKHTLLPPASIGNLSIDYAVQRVYVDDQDVPISQKEFLLLTTLMREQGRYLTSDQLYTMAWGGASLEDVRTVRVYIHHLRRKLEHAGLHIVYIRGQGYQLVVKPATD